MSIYVDHVACAAFTEQVGGLTPIAAGFERVSVEEQMKNGQHYVVKNCDATKRCESVRGDLLPGARYREHFFLSKKNGAERVEKNRFELLQRGDLVKPSTTLAAPVVARSSGYDFTRPPPFETHTHTVAAESSSRCQFSHVQRFLHTTQK